MTHESLPPLTPEEGGLHGDIPNTPEMRAWFQALSERTYIVTHDPLCPIQPPVVGSGSTDPAIRTMPESAGVPCQCSLIAKVRADEAPKAVTRWIEQGASSDDWMKVWQVRDYVEEFEARVRTDEKAKWTHVCPDNNCCHQSGDI